jgi:hypothetical protein
LLATALSVGPAAAGALPAIAPSAIKPFSGNDNGAGEVSEDLRKKSAELCREKPTAAKPGLHDLSITKVIDKASNPMMLMQAGAGFVPDGGLHPIANESARR